MKLLLRARRMILGSSLALGLCHLQAQTSNAAQANSQQTPANNISLYVTVVDSQRQLVNNLTASDFVVYEDGQAQKIIGFNHADLPASIGLVVDNSGSMREKRAKITAALLGLVKSCNPQDEFFVVNFNDEAYLDQDFTRDFALLHASLDRLDSRGGTALYDAEIASADHLSKAAKYQKRALVIVTDGPDNESNASLELALRAVEDENGPTVYTIGILSNERNAARARRALESFSLETGAVSYFPKGLEELDSVAQMIARELKSQYALTYISRTPLTDARSRQIKVVTPNHDFLTRTRTHYFPAQENPTKPSNGH